MGIREKSKERRKRMAGNKASGFEEAERRGLEFWQSQTPQQRLSALVSIRKDVLRVKQAKESKDKSV